jgi:hypothetical protein
MVIESTGEVQVDMPAPQVRERLVAGASGWAALGASMVCSDHATQPVVNTGSLYH